MATILVVGVDLFLRGKLEALLPEHHFSSSEGVDPPDLVIADVGRVDPDDVADSFPDVPLLGFTNHKDTDGLRRAQRRRLRPRGREIGPVRALGGTDRRPARRR